MFQWEGREEGGRQDNGWHLGVVFFDWGKGLEEGLSRGGSTIDWRSCIEKQYDGSAVVTLKQLTKCALIT